MNTLHSCTSKQTETAPRRRGWLQGALLGMLALALTGCFRVGPEARALRNSVLNSGGAEWDEQIEFSIGALTTGLARFGLGWVEMDPDARLAMKSIRGAQVGVYKLESNPAKLDRAALLVDADRAMERNGWERLVTVKERDELVLVYAPRSIRSPRNVKLCFAVLSNRDLVIGSARANLEPLLEIALKHSELHQRSRATAGKDAKRRSKSNDAGVAERIVRSVKASIPESETF